MRLSSLVGIREDEGQRVARGRWGDEADAPGGVRMRLRSSPGWRSGYGIALSRIGATSTGCKPMRSSSQCCRGLIGAGAQATLG